MRVLGESREVIKEPSENCCRGVHGKRPGLQWSWDSVSVKGQRRCYLEGNV